ncbi:MAG TPA: MarR family winged helix-turn-helix transcriptional regulator [Jiangellaceae bacterium]
MPASERTNTKPDATDANRVNDLTDAELAAVRVTRTLIVLANLISAPYYVNTQEPFGITLPEWRALREICEHPGITQTEIAEQTAQHIMTLSRSVRQLTNKGLIDGRVDPDDRRRTHLHPTPLAAEMAAEMRHREAVQVRHIVDGITDDEADQLVRIVDKLIDHVRTSERPDAPPASRDWRAIIDASS